MTPQAGSADLALRAQRSVIVRRLSDGKGIHVCGADLTVGGVGGHEKFGPSARGGITAPMQRAAADELDAVLADRRPVSSTEAMR